MNAWLALGLGWLAASMAAASAVVIVGHAGAWSITMAIFVGFSVTLGLLRASDGR